MRIRKYNNIIIYTPKIWQYIMWITRTLTCVMRLKRIVLNITQVSVRDNSQILRSKAPIKFEDPEQSEG
jgi:hypothetical protein